MDKTFFLSIVACCLFFFSCTENDTINRIHYQQFEKEIDLQPKVHEIDTPVFRYPYRVKRHDSLIIVFDLHNAEEYFHVFRYPSYGYVSSFGERGDESGGMLMAMSFRYCSNDRIWTLDSGNSNLVRFGFSNASGFASPTEMITLDKQKVGKALDFVVYNDSTFIIPDYTGKSRLLFVNGYGELTRRTGFVASEKKHSQASRPALTQAWRSFIDYNPHNGLVVLATQLGEIIELFDLNSDSHTVLIGEHGEPQFKISDEGYAIPTGIMGFSDICLTDKCIYAVFQGRSFDDIQKNARNGIRLNGGKFIYTFSLSGEPLIKYNLNCYVSGICVDEENKKIIAIDANNRQHFLEFGLYN